MPIITKSAQFPVADEDTPFDVTLAVAGTAEDLATVPSGKKGRIVSLVNEGPGKAYIAFDATATTASLVLDRGDQYAESGLELATKVSFVGEATKTPRVRGVLWSGF